MTEREKCGGRGTLGCEVAIKTRREDFAKGADRLARFDREAKLPASLNHLEFAAIHGLVPVWSVRKGNGVDTEEIKVEDGSLVWRRD